VRGGPGAAGERGTLGAGGHAGDEPDRGDGGEGRGSLHAALAVRDAGDAREPRAAARDRGVLAVSHHRHLRAGWRARVRGAAGCHRAARAGLQRGGHCADQEKAGVMVKRFIEN